jgi:hypothetical protein
MKPRIAFFAAASLVATGMTLASNVSFGQKAGKFLADAFDVMGPISSLMSGIVKPNLERPARPAGDYTGEAVASVKQDTVSQAMRTQSMVPSNIVVMAPAPEYFQSNAGITKSTSTQALRIEPGSGNVPATFSAPVAPVKTLKISSLLSAFEKGAPGNLSKEREDVWHFLNSRPGQFDNSRLVLSERSERVDKEVLGNANPAAVAVAPVAEIVNATQLTKNDIIGTTNANNLTAQSLLSKNSVAPIPVPASALVLVAGFASLFGVSLMAKKSKAKKSKKAAK